MNADDFLGFSNPDDDGIEFDIPDIDPNFLENNNLYFKSPDISCMYFTPYEDHKEVKLSVSLDGILQLRPAEKIRATIIFPFDSEIFNEHTTSLNTLEKWDLKGLAIQCISKEYYPTPQSPPVKDVPVMFEKNVTTSSGTHGFEIVFWLSEKENILSKYENGMFCVNFRIMSYHKKEFQTADIKIKFQMYIPHTFKRESRQKKNGLKDEEEDEGEGEDEEGDGFGIPETFSQDTPSASMVDEDEDEDELEVTEEQQQPKANIEDFLKSMETPNNDLFFPKVPVYEDNLRTQQPPPTKYKMEYKEDFFTNFETNEPGTNRKVQYVNKVLISLEKEDESLNTLRYDVSWRGNFRQIAYNSNYLSMFSPRALSSSDVDKSKLMKDEDDDMKKEEVEEEKEDLQSVFDVEDHISNSYHQVFEGLLDLVNLDGGDQQQQRQENGNANNQQQQQQPGIMNKNPFEAGGLKFFYEEYSVIEYSLQVVPFPFKINRSSGMVLFPTGGGNNNNYNSNNFMRIRVVFSNEIAKNLKDVKIGSMFHNENVVSSDDMMSDEDQEKKRMEEQGTVRMKLESVQLNDSSPNFWKMINPEDSPENIIIIQDPRIQNGVLFFSIQLNSTYKKFEKSKFCRLRFSLGVSFIQCELNVIFELEKNDKLQEEDEDEDEEKERKKREMEKNILFQVKQVNFRMNSNNYDMICEAMSMKGDNCTIENHILFPVITKCENKELLT